MTKTIAVCSCSFLITNKYNKRKTNTRRILKLTKKSKTKFITIVKVEKIIQFQVKKRSCNLKLKNCKKRV